MTLKILRFQPWTLRRSVSTGWVPCTPITLQDDMSLTHSKLLDVTLQSHLPGLKCSDCQTLPGSHFIFFNHAVPEIELSTDGYDNLQAPQNRQNLLRRWASGRLEFLTRESLMLGVPAICHESIHECKGKGYNTPDSTSEGSSKVSVTIARHFVQSGIIKIKEVRELIYFSASPRLLQRMKSLTNGQINKTNVSPQHSQEIEATDLLIFRFSALTFNAHRIHFQPHYAQTEEGLKSIIVQGPLMVSLMLRWACSHFAPRIKSLDYKVLGSINAGERFKLCASKVSGTKFHTYITTQKDSQLVFDSQLTVL